MTLTLDDVRNKRFRMARKSGYEVLEVDEFVDEVEVSFAQLVEENQNLRKQLDALKSGPPRTQPQAAAAAAPAQGPETIVVTTGKEASPAVVRLVEMSTEQAERLLAEAHDDANRIREEANRNAQKVTSDATTRAERVESEARVNAERLQADARARAQQLEREIDARRHDMVSQLERQQQDLSQSVRQLREFEASYRRNLGEQLRNHLRTLESGRAEPMDAPPLAKDNNANRQPRPPEQPPQQNGPSGRDEAPAPLGARASNTPRLDALLGDQR